MSGSRGEERQLSPPQTAVGDADAPDQSLPPDDTDLSANTAGPWHRPDAQWSQDSSEEYP